jgi:hypothetical protein
MTVALIAPAATGGATAAAIIPSASGIHLWLFDPGNGTPVNTTAEAQAVARAHDVVVAGAPYRQFISAMHTAHPGVLVLRYRSGIAAKKGSQLQWVLANHPDWLARDAEGSMLTNSFGNALLDVSNPEVVRWQVSWASGQARLGWDGIYLDAVGVFGVEGFSGDPIDPATGRPFTYDAWVGATRNLAAAVDAAVSPPVVTNGYRNGRYFAGLTDFGTSFAGTQMLVGAGQGGEFEWCFRRALDGPAEFPDATTFALQLSAIDQAQAGGHWAFCRVKVWQPATAAQLQRWHDFALAGFLLAAQDHAYFRFYGSRVASPLQGWGEDALAIGSPVEQRRLVAGVYLRRYQSAIVIVNPTAARVAVDLGGSYRLPGGGVVTRIDAGPDRGYVLPSSG